MEDFGAFVEFGEGHRENDFVNCLFGDAMEIIDSFKGTFKEDFEVIIIPDASFDELILEEGVISEQVVDLALRNLTQSGVVGRGYRSGSIGVVQEGNLSEVVTWIERSHLL